jgi:hypothetical protein
VQAHVAQQIQRHHVAAVLSGQEPVEGCSQLWTRTLADAACRLLRWGKIKGCCTLVADGSWVQLPHDPADHTGLCCLSELSSRRVAADISTGNDQVDPSYLQHIDSVLCHAVLRCFMGSCECLPGVPSQPSVSCRTSSCRRCCSGSCGCTRQVRAVGTLRVCAQSS